MPALSRNYAVAAAAAERRASRFTTPPSAPMARTPALSAGVQGWSIPNAASTENGPYRWVRDPPGRDRRQLCIAGGEIGRLIAVGLSRRGEFRVMLEFAARATVHMFIFFSSLDDARSSLIFSVATDQRGFSSHSRMGITTKTSVRFGRWLMYGMPLAPSRVNACSSS
jgi:hypothetical protein